MSRTPEQRREFTRLLEDMQCARCDGPQHEGACADRPPVSGEPPRRSCDPPTTHRYETVMTADGRFTTRIRCKRCGYEREG